MLKERREIFINPHYANLKEFVDNLPTHFDRGGTLIRRERNTVKYFDVDGVNINVKEFCTPPLFLNRFIYNFFRRPKAVRAYENAVRLSSVGIESPTPIAYILCKRGGMLLKSYFVSIHYSHRESNADFEIATLDSKTTDVLSEFGRFSAYLHNAGMFHGDYGNGNILINYVDKKPIFILIDTNRMKFGSISMTRGCKDFNRLNLSREKIAVIAKTYAEGRNLNEREVCHDIKKYQTQLKRKRRIKRLKSLIA